MIKLDNMDILNIIAFLEDDNFNVREKAKIIYENINNKNKQIEKCSTKIKDIFDYWNSKQIIVHKEINDSITKTIKNSLNPFGSESIKLAIDRYKQVLDDQSYFFKYKWSLKDFLSRKEGISSFLDDGTKWLNYQSFLNNQSSKQMFKSNVQRKDTSRINSDGIINL